VIRLRGLDEKPRGELKPGSALPRVTPPGFEPGFSP
jgi:hypothetical protein